MMAPRAARRLGSSFYRRRRAHGRAAARRRPCLWFDVRRELVPYAQALEWQRALARARYNRPELPDAVLVLEHPPVYTLGRGATADNVLFDPAAGDYELHRVERGGEVTYHGPGQLVVYPILHLDAHRRDLHWYVRSIEDVIIRVLGLNGVRGFRIDGLTGVWANPGAGAAESDMVAAAGSTTGAGRDDGRESGRRDAGRRDAGADAADAVKVAAVGINVSKWVTMHGFSINVNPRLADFARIVPCGIVGRGVGSLEHVCNAGDGGRREGAAAPCLLRVDDVREQVARVFSDVFSVELRHHDAHDARRLAAYDGGDGQNAPVL